MSILAEASREQARTPRCSTPDKTSADPRHPQGFQKTQRPQRVDIRRVDRLIKAHADVRLRAQVVHFIRPDFGQDSTQGAAIGHVAVMKPQPRAGFVRVTFFPALSARAGFGTAVLVYSGGLAAAEGTILLGSWFLFLQSLDAFWFPLMNLSAFWSQVQAGLAAIARVFALIDAQATVVQQRSDPLPELAGDIRFERLSFAYSNGVIALPDFSLHIRPGESVAFAGPPGAGPGRPVRGRGGGRSVGAPALWHARGPRAGSVRRDPVHFSRPVHSTSILHGLLPPAPFSAVLWLRARLSQRYLRSSLASLAALAPVSRLPPFVFLVASFVRRPSGLPVHFDAGRASGVPTSMVSRRVDGFQRIRRTPGAIRNRVDGISRRHSPRARHRRRLGSGRRQLCTGSREAHQYSPSMRPASTATAPASTGRIIRSPPRTASRAPARPPIAKPVVNAPAGSQAI